jgi:hypothetical protein
MSASEQRKRAYSHSRTNSSSSSASSPQSSPVLAPHSGIPFPVARSDSMSETSSLSGGYQYTPSEAAAVAALRNVNSVQITSTNRPHTEVDTPPVHGSASAASHGNKLTSVAASAAAFASRPKESALSKAKLFARQATKPHSAVNKKPSKSDLTIQTSAVSLPPSRPSLSERSPLSRPSRELERIASIGTVPLVGSASAAHQHQNSEGSNSKIHKHHLSFRPRKDSHGGVVLSSSSSNSKLISEQQGSIYSFHPSSPGMPTLERKGLIGRDDRDQQLGENAWALLCSRTLPLFNGENLRVPVEDLNSLVTIHLNSVLLSRGAAKDIVNEFRDFLRVGMFNLDTKLRTADDSNFINTLVEVWMTMFTQVLPYLIAVFLPLQAEFDGTGQILTPQEAKEMWRVIPEKEGDLNTRRYILMAFRDFVILPVATRLEREYDQSAKFGSFIC